MFNEYTECGTSHPCEHNDPSKTDNSSGEGWNCYDYLGFISLVIHCVADDDFGRALGHGRYSRVYEPSDDRRRSDADHVPSPAARAFISDDDHSSTTNNNDNH